MKLLTVIFLFLVVSCGAPIAQAPNEAGPSPAGNRPSGGSLTFKDDIKPVLAQYCSECHSSATFIANEGDFLASKAPTRIGNKSMPPSYSKNFAKWGQKQRDLVKSYVDGE